MIQQSREAELGVGGSVCSRLAEARLALALNRNAAALNRNATVPAIAHLSDPEHRGRLHGGH